MSNDTSKDFSREAAHHLRTVARERGLEIKSSTAHELIAGYFGFHSRAAMVATEAVEFPVMFPSPEGPKTFTQVVPKEGTPSLDDPFLFQTEPDIPSLERAIEKVGARASLKPEDSEWLAPAIQEGLVPACEATGIKSLDNRPLYDSDNNEPTAFASPEAVQMGQFKTCRCCDSDRLYPSSQINHNGLCPEHHDEFDQDPEEAKDWEDYIENRLNNL